MVHGPLGMNKPIVQVQDLGRISFQQAWDYQTELQQQIIQAKRSGTVTPDNYLLICEHNPVYTLGKSGSPDHLLIDVEQQSEFEYFKINRGGDITYHGPGQLTVYPIFDLEQFFTDVHRYVRSLEEVVIRSIAAFGIQAKRLEGFTGVWIDDHAQTVERKICAIGVHLSRWVSMHGLALNVNTDLSHFKHIVPCGIQDEQKQVTSMKQVLNGSIQLEEVKQNLVTHFSSVFEFEALYASLEQ